MSQFQTLGLIFEENSGNPLDSPPTFAHIYLKTFTTGRRDGFEGEVHSLTPVEYDADTFDHHADRLIENIQRLKKEARRKFEAAKRRKA